MARDLEPTTLVIFGASGDLSQRYLLPALAEICQNFDLKTHLKIVGISRRPVNSGDILGKHAANLADQFKAFQMDYELAEEYRKLREELISHPTKQVIFYFAVPPEAVPPIINMLGQAKMNTGRYKLLMEKPFGRDLTSAKKLISQTARYFKEEQIYRIDHYLAKEMAQNIAVFLGSNALFRGIWNNQFIEKIEIVAQESIGIKGREHFYEQTGALRDIVQSHLLQLAALTLMDPCPDVFDFSQVQSRRLAALKQLRAVPDSFVRGQYKGYRQEVGNTQSDIETFAALTLQSADPKWQGVPIRLITGKKLQEKLTEIKVFFKKTQAAQANMLRLRVQPKEGIELELWVKKPGYDQDLQMLPLDFSYQQHFDRLPDAYEQVIVDAIRGRSNLFAGSGEVVSSWEILQPLLDRWDKYELKIYKAGLSASEVLKNT